MNNDLDMAKVNRRAKEQSSFHTKVIIAWTLDSIHVHTVHRGRLQCHF